MNGIYKPYPVEPIVLIHKIDFTLPNNTFHHYLETIIKNKQNKIMSYKFRKDALRSLYGELLLKYALIKYYDLNYQKEIFYDNGYGKPCLKNHNIFFNISHSGDWVVFVSYISDVGIDIEKIENPPYEVMSKIFTSDESLQIMNTFGPSRAKKFYSFWALKESYLKMLGKGLSINPDSFSINLYDNKTIDINDKENNTKLISLELYYPDPVHVMAVCIRNCNKQLSPFFVLPDKFEDFLRKA
jgi:4'-phosphopantetheinyl transferase